MKLSLDWLSDFVAFTETNPQKIAEAITLSVAEVEEVEEQGALLGHCVVGKVDTIKKHPNADKLSLCIVLTEQGKKNVVCGGTNLRQGMLVAFAHVGARVKWHGGEMMELAKTKIRGEESEGMICSSSELDLTEQFPTTDDHHIIDLGDDGYNIGTPLKAALQLDDIVFHIDNHAITNRADLFSHIGFARECVAIGLGKWKKKPEVSPPKFGKGTIPFTFVVDAPKLMPRYLSTLIEIDGIGETPDWMKKRLRSVGWRPISLPIDITNYVATEIGVPLHSFDADDIAGTVHMRTSKKGEKIVTLDHQERSLPEEGLVLSDDKGIFDLLGIMGGLRSSTKDTTKRIYLHSATLDPLSIRRTIIATGHRTDAATVYEKGVPPITTEQGFYRAAGLMLELIPGARIVSKLESKGENGTPKKIIFSLEHASSILGRTISQKEASKIFSDLGCTVAGIGNVFTITPPLHRIGDMKESIDLVEEVARIAGFKSFEEELPTASILPPERDCRVNSLRNSLKEEGCIETVQFAFLGEELLMRSKTNDRSRLREIENPIGEDMKFMRPSLLPRLLEYGSDTMRLTSEDLKIFEIGHIFTNAEEHQSLTLLVAQVHSGGLKDDPLLSAKEAFKAACGAMGYAIRTHRNDSPSSVMHPGRTANVFIGERKIGELYEVHPEVAKNFGFPHRVAVVSIELDILLSLQTTENTYKHLFEFPSIAYDATIVFDPATPVGPFLEKVEGMHEFLREVKLVDLFEKEGKRHLTVRCTYNAGDRTLKEEEVKPIQEKVEALLRT